MTSYNEKTCNLDPWTVSLLTTPNKAFVNETIKELWAGRFPAQNDEINSNVALGYTHMPFACWWTVSIAVGVVRTHGFIPRIDSRVSRLSSRASIFTISPVIQETRHS
jgi:hypothetical protein